MDDCELTRWIRGLIRDGRIHEFYDSGIWRRKRAEILRARHNECQRCRAKGLYRRADTVHHKAYLRARPELALTDGNLEALCGQCHYDEHHARMGFTNEERW